MGGERASITSFADPPIEGDCDDFFEGCRGVVENRLIVGIEGNIIGDGYLTADDRGIVPIGFFEESKLFGGETLEEFCRIMCIPGGRCKEANTEKGEEVEGTHYLFG